MPEESQRTSLFSPLNQKYSIQPGNNSTWKMLIVDDDPDIHQLTRLVLHKLTFMEKGLEFISAFSGEEAREKLLEHPDIAVVILDVVMENEHAGLDFAKYIREDLKNHFIRIILRTGQPGRAPEGKVVLDYDINDYKEKTELTAQKFHTTTIASLRSYRDMVIIESNRQALEKIISASTTIMRMKSMRLFASNCLNQLISILSINTNVLYCQAEGFTAEKNEEEYYILAGVGAYEETVDKKVHDTVPSYVIESFEESVQKKKSLFFDDYYIGYFESCTGSINVVYVEGWDTLGDLGKQMINMFCQNISIAYDNICRKQDFQETSEELLCTLGQAAETHMSSMGNHIKRVSEYSKILATHHGMTEEEIEVVGLASTLHDIGHLAITPDILHKTETPSEEDYKTLKKHPELGNDLLKTSNKKILQSAATIALQHQEKFDGTGYPNGLKGDGIHIYAQITGLSDVFDSLACDKVYRAAWGIDKILEYLKNQKGKHFNPHLVDLLLDNLDEFLQIKEHFVDPPLAN